jgi:glucose/arabinose dehydrogenase
MWLLVPLIFGLVFLGLLPAHSASAEIGTVRFATGLNNPTYLTAPQGDLNRVFVTERTGSIKILDTLNGAIAATPFLSLTDVETLAAIAFHPDYSSNGRFFVFYRDTSNLVRVERYEVMAGDPEHADISSATPVLSLSNPGHSGGWIGFGPDGYLYIQIGDGGDFMSHDAPGNGQGITTELNGNILRVDVDGDDFPVDPLRNYAIPSSNPFVDMTGLDEIWAFGLRNPWRGSFDRLTGDYYFADFGQDTREEIDFEEFGSSGGRNYGWRLREGAIATPTGGVGGTQPPGGIDPVYDYVHAVGSDEGESVTGGYVYRGPVTDIRGRYFFADYSNPRIWSIQVDSASHAVTEFVDWTVSFAPDFVSFNNIVSFGEDALGNLYIIDFDGEIFKVMDTTVVPMSRLLGLVLMGCGLVLSGRKLLSV